MKFLVPSAYALLVQFDFYLTRRDFSALYNKVRNFPSSHNGHDPDALARICLAVDTACVWYWKEVLCLQRSAATTCLLKSAGLPARMVIGTQRMPFKAHAWVEIECRVVNDKPYMREMYAVLDQC